jgi:DNA-binding GntR family transcriptional regulator
VKAISRQDGIAELRDFPAGGAGSGADGVYESTLTQSGEELSRVSSGEQVRLYVRRRIFDGVLKQGQRVPQDAIAQTLGVSRIPVREALIALEREGWVTIYPHRGAFVNSIDEPGIRDHYELFGLFYGFAVRRAIERQGVSLGRALAPMQKRIAAVGDDVNEMFDATMAFHRTVVVAASSPRLRSLLRQTTGIVPGNFFELVPGSGKVEKQGTAAILRAVKSQDAAGAAEAYAAMMRRQADLVVNLFQAKGVFEQSS